MEAMNRLWWATLDPTSPRYETWRAILGSQQIPLKSPAPAKADLGQPKVKEKNVQVYQLDAQALTEEQRDRLIAFCCEKFKVPDREVIETVARDGFPVRAEDVIVAFDMRAFA
jgi:hypothetical protein